MDTDQTNETTEQRVPPVKEPSAAGPGKKTFMDGLKEGVEGKTDNEALQKMSNGLKAANKFDPTKLGLGIGLLLGFLYGMVPQQKDALTQLQEVLAPRDPVSEMMPRILYMVIGGAVGAGVSLLASKK